MAKTKITYAKRSRRKGKALMTFSLEAKVRHSPNRPWQNLGVICERIVTNAAIAELISVLQAGSAVTLQNFKFHASGTGVNAESATDTALQTEVETRDTGTQTSPGAGQYRTVATHTYAGTFAITEHGVFSLASGGVLLDRSVFASINVVNGSQIQWTYTLTVIGS